MIITIDGPSGSGKSTIAHRLGKDFGFFVLNTGFLYRAYAVAFLAMTQGKNNTILQQSDLEDLVQRPITYNYFPETGSISIMYDGCDVTPLLKTPEIDKAASVLSKNRLVRTAVTQQAHFLAEGKQSIVVEGRDCGSIMFPHADLKLFLTASEEVRAERIARDKSRSTHMSVQEAQKALHERDTRDSNRIIAPLTIPSGAVVIDTSTQSIDTVLNKISELIKN